MMPRSLRTGSSFSSEPTITPAKQIVVPAEILRGRVQHVVDAGRDGPHVVGRAKRGVDQRFDAVFVTQTGEAIEIDHAQVRIRGRFADQQPGLAIDGRFHGVVVAGRHLARDDAEPRHVLRAELAAAVVTLVEEDHLVAAFSLAISRPTTAAMPLEYSTAASAPSSAASLRSTTFSPGLP